MKVNPPLENDQDYLETFNIFKENHRGLEKPLEAYNTFLEKLAKLAGIFQEELLQNEEVKNNPSLLKEMQNLLLTQVIALVIQVESFLSLTFGVLPALFDTPFTEKVKTFLEGKEVLKEEIGLSKKKGSEAGWMFA